MRFAHLADTHLGYRQYNLDEREEDFYRSFQEAVSKIIEAKCDFVVHSGDLFDSPRPHVRAMLEVMHAFERLDREGIKVFTIAGNHDMLFRKGAVPPQRLYSNIEFLTPKNPFRVFKGIFVCGLPYHSRIHSRALKERLHLLAKEAREYDTRIILIHQGIDKYFPLQYELKIGDLPEGFQYYALGHIHKRILDTLGEGVLAYPGSSEMWRIDELQDWKNNGKGFYVVDIPGFKVKKVDLRIRPFFTVNVSSIEDIHEARRNIHFEEQPIVKVVVTAEPSEYNRLYKALLSELKETLYLDIRRKNVGEADLEEVKPINLRELIGGELKGHTEAEKIFAYAVFETLSEGDIESARNIIQEFYEKWGSEEKKVKDHGQLNLGAFK